MDAFSLQKVQDATNHNQELEVLSNVLQNLFERGFISHMEYRKAICTNITDRRESIYRMMITKDLKTASKIFNTVRSYWNLAFESDDLNNDDFGDGEVVPNNPLKIEEVIQTVLGFLKVTDLKNCRLVCEKWNAVAEPIFRKRCKIMFTSENNPSLSPKTFLDTFKYSLPNIPFTAFVFHDYFTIPELTHFFTSYGKNITELEINVCFEEHNTGSFNVDDFDTDRNKIDITPWISESNLKKLHLSDRYYGRFFVSWNILHSVQDLFIDKAAVNISSDVHKITPSRIYLTDVVFFTGGNKLKRLNIDEIVNFTQANDILLVSEDYKTTYLTIDLAVSKVIAQNVYFQLINVLNWRFSTWEVQKLTLIDDIDLLEKCEIPLKELCFGQASIDLSVLPDTIERLSLKPWNVIFSQPTSFPNLQILKFGCNAITAHSVLPLFSTCENLTELLLIDTATAPHSASNIQINIDRIPRSVKKLKLKGSKFEIVGDTVLNLQLLLLQNCKMEAVRQWISKLKYEVLIIKKDWMNNFNDIDNQLVPFIRQFNQSERIYYGAFKWIGFEMFWNTIFKDMVDEKSEAYVFTQKIGSSITKEEFKKINNFYKITYQEFKQ